MNGIRLDELTLMGEGREAQVFALDDSRVLRLSRSASQAAAVDAEHAALVAALDVGAPVPGVFERVDVDGRPGLVLERLRERNLLLEIGERPWRVWTISRSLGRLHARIHAARGPDELPSVHSRLRARLESPLVPEELRARALARLDELPAGDRLCHGDFHPGNVLVGDDVEGGRDAIAIDWTGAARGEPAADVARSFLIIRFGAVGPDATRAVAALARVGRRVLWKGYAGAYGIDRAAVKRWLPVVAAARLAEDIAGERARLLELAT